MEFYSRSRTKQLQSLQYIIKLGGDYQKGLQTLKGLEFFKGLKGFINFHYTGGLHFTQTEVWDGGILMGKYINEMSVHWYTITPLHLGFGL